MRYRLPNGISALPSTASPSSSADLKRRRFLFALGAGGASAAGAAVAALPDTAAAVAPKSAGATDSGYRETEHVRDYYRTARI